MEGECDGRAGTRRERKPLSTKLIVVFALVLFVIDLALGIALLALEAAKLPVKWVHIAGVGEDPSGCTHWRPVTHRLSGLARDSSH
jgi:hypothetical protein